MQDSESDFALISAEFSDRRRDSPMPVILELLRLVHKGQKELDEKLVQHMTNETAELAKAMTKLMQEAFPYGDPLGHRLAHEVRIEKEKERTAFWREMRIHGAKWLGLGLLSFVVGALWVTFKAKINS